ncbi:FG-GAP-like repeat-containing protein [Rubinisphaera margarita]|uniref:FG-GAP-like repeat-containing protein n=1 Tax=Rubinisphaera margarita TaxID=2909586 RepID=UPI001EE87A33|nr:FG-GAP-like repeat-containing protein [Rubinisphaera margarita]MCG6156584.1 FG-GAP-like repeat-containing protein [Rubinisphaera margarita]
MVERCEDRLLLTDLSVSITEDASSIVTGESIRYTVLVTNNGSEDVSGVALESAISFFGGTYSISGESLTFPGGGSGTLVPEADGPDLENLSLAAGTSARLTYTLTALSGAGTVLNTSTVAGSTPEDTDLSNNTVVRINSVDVPTTDLDVSQTSSAAEIATGEGTVYSVVISNRGPQAVSGVSFVNTLAYAGGSISVSNESLSFSGISSATLVIEANGPDLTDLSLASGESATLIFTVTPTSGTGAIISSSTVYGGTPADTNYSNNSAVIVTPVNAPAADLAVSQSESRDSIYSEESTVYTVVIRNNGPQAVSGGSLVDTISFPGGTYTVSNESLVFSGTGSGTLVVKDDGPDLSDLTLASGETATLTFTVSADSGTGSITNTATVSGGSPFDPDEANDTSVETTTVNPIPADLSVTRSGSNASLLTGGSAVYTIVLTNNGPKPVTGASLTDTVSFTGGTYTISDESLVFSGSGSGTLIVEADGPNLTDLSLASGETATLQFTISIVDGTGVLTNSAVAVGGAPVDDNSSNNELVEQTIVIPLETIVVTTVADENDGTIDSSRGAGVSLREALLAANLNADINTVTFHESLNGSEILLTIAGRGEDGGATGDLDLTQPIIIAGNGQTETVINGNDLDRVFDIFNPSDVQFEFRDLTITGGDLLIATSGNRSGAGIRSQRGDLVLNRVTMTDNHTYSSGGAISFRSGALVVTDSVFTDNTVYIGNGGVFDNGLGSFTISGSRFERNLADRGGAIHSTSGVNSITNSVFIDNVAESRGGAFSSIGSDLVLHSSLFEGNEAAMGGGAFYTYLTDLEIMNSTFSGNTSGTNGGGLELYGGDVRIVNSTVTGNVARSGNSGSGQGGGIKLWDSFGERYLFNSIIAGNFAGTTPDDLGTEIGNLHTSSAYNLIGDTRTAEDFTNGTNGNIVGVDVAEVLDPQLADNGGSTRTHKLIGATAIDAGLNLFAIDEDSNALPYDQRGEGFERIVNGIVDIGAFEFAPATPVLLEQSFIAAENQVQVGTVAASDGDQPRDELTFTLTGNGADATLFAISPTGELSFISAPSFETLGDADKNNVYQVEVQVEDQYGEVAVAVMSVTVQDVNELPTVALENAVTELPEDADTTSRLKVADIVVSDDALGTNSLSLTGSDADLFEVDGGVLYLSAGTQLDFETKSLLSVTVEVDDAALGSSPDSSVSLTITIGDVAEGPFRHPESSIVGFVNGKWWMARPEDSGNYTNQVAASGPASSFQKTLQGDFNGDGLQDLAVWLHNDQWRIGLADGNGQFTFTTWTTWGHPDIKEVHVGDFNNDGKDDIIGLFRNGTRGRWWVGQSDGSRFVNRHWGDYGNYDGIETVLVGNFDGLKGDDLTVVATSGVVWMVKTSNTRFQYLNSHRWNLSNGFEFAQVGNFNGDSRDDVLAVFGTGRERYVVVAKSIGAADGFYSGLWSTWTVNDALSGVVVGDFDGDGRDSVAGLFNGTNVWMGQSTGQRFLMAHWLDWTVSAGRLHDVMVGDSNGDGLSDLFARAADGTWHAAESTGDSFVDRPLSEWYAALDWRYVHIGRFATPPSVPYTPAAFEIAVDTSSPPPIAVRQIDQFAGRWVVSAEDRSSDLPEANRSSSSSPRSGEGLKVDAEFEEFSHLGLLEYLDAVAR